MTSVAELVVGDWQEILLEETYNADSDLLKALVKSSKAKELNHFEVGHALIDAANRYVARVNALPGLDDGF